MSKPNETKIDESNLDFGALDLRFYRERRVQQGICVQRNLRETAGSRNHLVFAKKSNRKAGCPAGLGFFLVRTKSLDHLAQRPCPMLIPNKARGCQKMVMDRLVFQNGAYPTVRTVSFIIKAGKF